MSEVTLAQLRALARELNKWAIPVRRVETEEQARAMSARDPFGYIWSVGEEYYEGTDLKVMS